MSKSKIAPTLQGFFGGKRNPFRNLEEDKALRSELRSLLSVARAARSWAEVDRFLTAHAPCPKRCEHYICRLWKALARLDRVSGGGK